MRNPVTTKKHYRLYVAYKLPHVRLLDFRKIKQKVPCSHDCFLFLSLSLSPSLSLFSESSERSNRRCCVGLSWFHLFLSTFLSFFQSTIRNDPRLVMTAFTKTISVDLFTKRTESNSDTSCCCCDPQFTLGKFIPMISCNNFCPNRTFNFPQWFRHWLCHQNTSDFTNGIL